MDATCEVWRETDFPPYMVSNLGRVKHALSGRVKSAYRNSNGYMIVGFNHSVKKRVHVLVAAAFIGPKPLGMDVNHKDGVKSNNRVENLEYMTRSENCKHGFRLGLSYTPFRNRGEEHCRSILRDADVRAIREGYKNGVSRRALATKYEISYYTIWDITERRSWTHLVDN